ncbi:MAG: NUDIX domain-containing protein [Ancalomicrobiaceae bacterium]|nr:NUDIX domain-containing protein [Ancalomicrobiaceae bacterium]
MKQQVAALPLMVGENGERRVYLLTSRETRRWVIPKGWPMKGLRRHEAAAREAFEEAGLVGKIEKKPVGRYEYMKRVEDGFHICGVDVFLMAVKSRVDEFPEKGEREVVSVPLHEASERVIEPGLKAILQRLTSAG